MKAVKTCGTEWIIDQNSEFLIVLFISG